MTTKEIRELRAAIRKYAALCVEVELSGSYSVEDRAKVKKEFAAANNRLLRAIKTVEDLCQTKMTKPSSNL